MNGLPAPLLVPAWQVGMTANSIIAVAYLLICLAIVVPLARSGQLRSNPLGAATAAIFFTCAVHHGSHAAHMLLPAFGLDDPQGLTMRAAWDWPLAAWDVVGAGVAAYYWTLRRTYSSLMQGASLFEDMRTREKQALELNDGVLQGLVVAKMALDLHDVERAEAALSSTIDTASRIITQLLGNEHTTIDLLRSAPAVVDLSPGSTPQLAHDREVRVGIGAAPSAPSAAVTPEENP